MHMVPMHRTWRAYRCSQVQKRRFSLVVATGGNSLATALINEHLDQLGQC
jgi:hypothetical protein